FCWELPCVFRLATFAPCTATPPPPSPASTATTAARTIARARRGREARRRQPRYPRNPRPGAGFSCPRRVHPPPAVRHRSPAMCSILGIFDLRPGVDVSTLRPLALSLSALQRHRGPDWSGVHADANALLVHERLAIVDPLGGAQPLLSAGGNLVLAVNGEIYNHRELEQESGTDYAFQSGSDCEVINALYAESVASDDDDATGDVDGHGTGHDRTGAWLSRLNGIFALALGGPCRR